MRSLAAMAAMTVMAALAAAATAAPNDRGPPNALQGFAQNRDQPVKIRSAKLEVREKDKIATFSGEVFVVNGDTELRCATLAVFYADTARPAPGAKSSGDKPNSEKPNGDTSISERQVERIEAKGGVIVVQKDQHATGDTATFDMRSNIVMLVGNVVVMQAGSIVRGRRLTVDLTTGVSKMDQAEALIPRMGGERLGGERSRGEGSGGGERKR
jgi:lipopolysaccharide export system protein LptA